MENKEPHIIRGAFDSYAFNALAVMELIVAFHGGNKKIWVPADQLSFVLQSDPGKALIADGWSFFPMPN